MKKMAALIVGTLMIFSLVEVAPAVPHANAATLTLSKSSYYDKTLAGILGQVGGVLSGYEFVSEEPLDDYYWLGPVHGPYSGRSGSYYPQPWNVRIENDQNGRILSDDDYHIDFLNQLIIDQHGAAVTSQYIKEEWKYHQVNDWGGGAVAMENMNNKDMLPPFTGQSDFNRFYWLSEPFIENDTLGMNAPGMPQTAANLAEKFSSVTGEFDSVIWAKFQATMYSLAYFETDSRVVLDKASSVLPRDSWPYQIYLKAKSLHEINPNDWRWAQRELRKVKRLVYGYDNIQVIPDINNGLVILSILYGNNDYLQSAKISSLIGYDADCTASFVMGLMGILKGMAGTPQEVKDAVYANGNGVFINDLNFTPHMNANYPAEQKFTDIANLYESNTQKFVLAAGGSADANNFYIHSEPYDSTPSVALILNNDFEQGNLNGWQHWQPVVDNAKIFAENNGTAMSGNWKGTVVTDDTVNEGMLYVTVSGLQNGTAYRAKAYLEAADGQEARLFADNYGGSYVYSAISSRPDYYSARTVDFVPSNGSARIGLHVPAGVTGLKWAAIDNLTLWKVDQPAGTPYEAESAARSGGSVRNSGSASGGQYVGGLDNVGNYVQFSVNAPAAGEYNMRVNYANGWTTEGRLSLYVNNVKQGEVSFPRTQRWGTFSQNILNVPVELASGSNTIKLQRDGNNGYVELDIIHITSFPQPIHTSALIPVIENESFDANAATQAPSGWETWPGNAGVDADADFTESGSRFGSQPFDALQIKCLRGVYRPTDYGLG